MKVINLNISSGYFPLLIEDISFTLPSKRTSFCTTINSTLLRELCL